MKNNNKMTFLKKSNNYYKWKILFLWQTTKMGENFFPLIEETVIQLQETYFW